MRQEEDSKILSKLGKKSGFTTPENYFNDFAKTSQRSCQKQPLLKRKKTKPMGAIPSLCVYGSHVCRCFLYDSGV